MSDVTTASPTRRLPSKGQATRQAILRAAADIASIEGLEGMSIGRLAKALGMSKSGLYAHFGSKEELQLAAIEAAVEIAAGEIVKPTLSMKHGLARVWALCEGYISYQERKVFPGGCFFGNVGPEVDARPGPLRERVAEVYKGLAARFVEALEGAQAAGEVDRNADPAQESFVLLALCREGARLFLLDDDRTNFARARRAIRERLQALATPKAPPLPERDTPGAAGAAEGGD